MYSSASAVFSWLILKPTGGCEAETGRAGSRKDVGKMYAC